MPVYINDTSIFLPNEPVANDDMELYLGYINGKPSKSKSIVLRNNGIKNRYYALSKGGKPTHTNAQMTAEAVRALFKDDPDQIKKMDLLSCGTSSPDQMMPSHGVMTHGWLPEAEAIEVVSPSGVCCAGMHALKYAYMSIKTGDAKNSPWPFKVNAVTGKVAELGKNDYYKEPRTGSYTANWTGTMQLFTELIKLHKGDAVKYQAAFNKTLKWF